jgi:hypothetical protein
VNALAAATAVNIDLIDGQGRLVVRRGCGLRLDVGTSEIELPRAGTAPGLDFVEIHTPSSRASRRIVRL